MLDRREILNRVTVGGLLSAFAAPASAQAGRAAPDDAAADREVAKAVQAVRDEIARQSTFWEIAAVRDQLRTYLRTTAKFPDYIEVGGDIWQQVYDWHVRYQQPATIGRTPDGRYTIVLMETTVILRPDLTPGFIGLPYDNR
jgi:hypothetical protein